MELSVGFMPLVDLRFTEASRLKTQEAHSIIALLARYAFRILCRLRGKLYSLCSSCILLCVSVGDVK